MEELNQETFPQEWYPNECVISTVMDAPKTEQLIQNGLALNLKKLQHSKLLVLKGLEISQRTFTFLFSSNKNWLILFYSKLFSHFLDISTREDIQCSGDSFCSLISVQPVHFTFIPHFNSNSNSILDVCKWSCSLKVKLHGTICNNDFQRITALQSRNNVASKGYRPEARGYVI